MKKLILFVVICMLMSAVAYAQDPGVPDTVIVDSINVPNGTTIALMPIYVSSDDSVATYVFPLAWLPRSSNVHAIFGTQYFAPLNSWDLTYDTLMLDEGYMRQIGIADLLDTTHAHIPIMNNNQRQHVWSLRMSIPPGTNDLAVTLDTIQDDRNGGLTFGLADGIHGFVPIFKKGHIIIGNPLGISDDNPTPKDFALNQNYPNPFNPETNIEFSLPKEQDVVLSVFNLLGQNVRTLLNSHLGVGQHIIRWDGRNDRGDNVPSGIYFYKIYTQEFSQTNKMVLLR